IDHPADDRTGGLPAEGNHTQDRIDVGRYIENDCGDQQPPGATHAVGLAAVQNGAAARAEMAMLRLIAVGYQQAASAAGDRVNGARRRAHAASSSSRAQSARTSSVR